MIQFPYLHILGCHKPSTWCRCLPSWRGQNHWSWPWSSRPGYSTRCFLATQGSKTRELFTHTEESLYSQIKHRNQPTTPTYKLKHQWLHSLDVNLRLAYVTITPQTITNILLGSKPFWKFKKHLMPSLSMFLSAGAPQVGCIIRYRWLMDGWIGNSSTFVNVIVLCHCIRFVPWGHDARCRFGADSWRPAAPAGSLCWHPAPSKPPGPEYGQRAHRLKHWGEECDLKSHFNERTCSFKSEYKDWKLTAAWQGSNGSDFHRNPPSRRHFHAGFCWINNLYEYLTLF